MMWMFIDDGEPESVEYDTNYVGLDIRYPHNPRPWRRAAESRLKTQPQRTGDATPCPPTKP